MADMPHLDCLSHSCVRQHAVEPVVGWRVSLVYFTPSHLHALDQEHRASLKQHGFPCQSLAMAHGWSTSITICADAWHHDLEDM
eukprot:1825218-Amphidinium_carterae.1